MADRDLNDARYGATTGTTTGTTTGATGADTDLRRLSDLDDFEVADGHPDIRGWKVRTPDGQVLGKVDDLIVSVREMRVRYIDVDVDRSIRSGAADAATPKGAETGHALVPIGTAQLDDAGDDVIVRSLTGADLASYPLYARQGGITRDYEQSLRGRFGGATTGAAAAGASSDFYENEHYDESRLFDRKRNRAGKDEQRLTLSEEELSVGKRQVQAGEVEVRKSVETEHVKQQVPVTREEVTVERRPANDRMAAADIGDDAIRIPLTQEEVVVDKRPVAKEQIIVRKHAVTENRTIDADVRKERVDVSGDTQRAQGGASGFGASGSTGAADRATKGGLGDRLADKVDNLKDRVDGNPASKPGPDATDRRF
jgi:uncharacterized protein (TIGR02271 family)